MRAKQFAVLGLGRFGSSLAMTLAEAGYEVMAIDRSIEHVQAITPFVTQAVQADVTDIDNLKELGLRNFDVAVVAIGKDLQSSLMATLLLKEIGTPYVVAKASTSEHRRVLEKLGADRIISPEEDMGKRLANNLIAGNAIDYIELSNDYSIMEIGILDEWVGHTICDLNIRARYGINIIAVECGGEINILPSADYQLKEHDKVVVVGNNNSIKDLEERRHA